MVALSSLENSPPRITVAHSRLPGCIIFAFPRPSEVVVTIADEITPIINPVSSKFQISDSSIPYLATIFRTSRNQSNYSWIFAFPPPAGICIWRPPAWLSVCRFRTGFCGLPHTIFFGSLTPAKLEALSFFYC